MKGKSDIANFALRAFLGKVGHRYDELRGLEPFKPTKRQWSEVLAFFDGACCFCGVVLVGANTARDHLVPLNKKSLGLHAWGNIVPSCLECNKQKHFGHWEEFLAAHGADEATGSRIKRIRAFQEKYRYEPDLRLQAIADNLYEDVGTVAMTLVELRFKQAETALATMLSGAKVGGT